MKVKIAAVPEYPVSDVSYHSYCQLYAHVQVREKTE